jgi:hypothetical protein
MSVLLYKLNSMVTENPGIYTSSEQTNKIFRGITPTTSRAKYFVEKDNRANDYRCDNGQG